MNSIIKPIIAGLIVLTFFSLVGTRVQTVTNRDAENELSYALRVATQDATADMIDKNHMMDGIEGDGNFKIDLNAAETRFLKSFKCNIGSCVDASRVNSMNIPLSGYVGYKYIVGRLTDGTITFPFSYVHTIDDQIYNFTLGETVYVTDALTGVETEKKMSDFAENHFHSDISNKDFRTITIMQTISEFLSVFGSNPANLMVQNAGTGMTFTLGGVDYTNSDPSQLVEFSAVIDGPGYFAVTDMYDPQLGGRIRTVTFGGAEYISLYA